MIRGTSYVLAVVAAVFLACGGNSENSSGQNLASSTTDRASASGAADEAGSTGIGPISHVDLATLDSAMARTGMGVFEAKCTPCHKMAERYVGPALEGVTKRRKPEWIMNMILNPDQMVKEDTTARHLLAEFLAPMTNQNLTQDEAKAVLAYFLEYDNSASE